MIKGIKKRYKAKLVKYVKSFKKEKEEKATI